MKDPEAFIGRLKRCVVDEGPRPDYHQAQMERLRVEWPTLWALLCEVSE